MATKHNNGPLHPMAQLDAHEAALAARLGVAEAPYHPPAEKFYHSNYLGDGCIAADLRTDFGYFYSAAKQLNSFRKNQRPSGMVPGVSHPPKSWTWNPERWLSTMPFDSLDYTQSPIWAYSVLKLHDAASSRPAANPDQAINPDQFLDHIHTDLDRHYQYLIAHRQVAENDPRVFIIHPHEANRDSGPEYDQWKQEELERQLGKLAIFLKRKARTSEHMPAWFNKRNRTIDYVGAIAINLANYKADWDPARIHETTEFIDVWFNCLLYENYLAMSEISDRVRQSEKAAMYKQLALKLEQKLVEKHYDQAARNNNGASYSVYNGRLIYRDTIGNLLTFLLKNLPPNQLRSNHKLVEQAFKTTSFILPSVATDDIANFDPCYEEYDRHWRSPVWPVANRLVMRGQEIQIARGDDIPYDLKEASQELYYDIHHSNLAMVAVTGDYAEHHSPIDGLGQRMAKTRGHVFGVTAHAPINPKFRLKKVA